MSDQQAFLWERQESAEMLLVGYTTQLCRDSSRLADFETQLQRETSTRLFDWIDHLALPYSEAEESKLLKAGFEKSEDGDDLVFHHPGAQLPRLVFHQRMERSIFVSVDSIPHFLLVHGHHTQIEGTPYSGYRRTCVFVEGGVHMWVVERRGTKTLTPTHEPPEYLTKYLHAKELWQTRPRDWEDEDALIDQAIVRAQQMSLLVGCDVGAYLALEGERDFWQARNKAGQVQKMRQDRLGMGWANHDHHTFRSSRRLFPKLVHLFELFGFHCRERFYAGEEAGWGAQVMENSVSGHILFCDVDLKPDEVTIDFAHHPLPKAPTLGTIGLWCGLHGDSITIAGMHHLECQFEFDRLRQDLADLGVAMMEPFSNFDHLKQAFTKGEVWSVKPARVNALVRQKLITEAQANGFLEKGAVGSHMENLQRRDGFKGFNQKNVSYIIAETDPRTISQSIGA